MRADGLGRWGGRWLRLGGGSQLVVLEGLLGGVGGGGADGLVDRQCLAQVRGGFTGIAVLKVGLAESFQGASFLKGHAEVAGDGKRPGVTFAGLAGGRGRSR